MKNLPKLPPESITELNLPKTSEIETETLAYLNALGGTANLNNLIIHIFKKNRKSNEKNVPKPTSS